MQRYVAILQEPLRFCGENIDSLGAVAEILARRVSKFVRYAGLREAAFDVRFLDELRKLYAGTAVLCERNPYELPYCLQRCFDAQRLT